MQRLAERDQSRLYLIVMLATAVAIVGVVLFGVLLPNLHAAAPPASSNTAPRDSPDRKAPKADSDPPDHRARKDCLVHPER